MYKFSLLLFTLFLIKNHALSGMDFIIPDLGNSNQYLSLLPTELKIHIIQSMINSQGTLEDVYVSLNPLMRASKEYYKLIPQTMMDYYKNKNPVMFHDYCYEIALRIGALKWIENDQKIHKSELTDFHFKWFFNIDCINNQALRSLFKWACMNQYLGLINYLFLKNNSLINTIDDHDWLKIIEKQNLRLVKLLIKYGKSNKNLQDAHIVDVGKRYKDDCILIHTIYQLKKWSPIIEFFCSDNESMHKAIEFLKKEINLNAHNDNYIRILLNLANKIKPSKEHEIEIFLKNLGKRDDYFTPLAFVSRRNSIYH